MKNLQAHAWAVLVNGNIFVMEHLMGENSLSLFRTKKEAESAMKNFSPKLNDEKFSIEKVYINTKRHD